MTGPAEDRSSRPRRKDVEDEPAIPSVSRDDSDVGWGDEASHRDAEWYERERPPHHE